MKFSLSVCVFVVASLTREMATIFVSVYDHLYMVIMVGTILLGYMKFCLPCLCIIAAVTNFVEFPGLPTV